MCVDHGERQPGQGQAHINRPRGTCGQDQVFTWVDTAGSAKLEKVIRKIRSIRTGS